MYEGDILDCPHKQTELPSGKYIYRQADLLDQFLSPRGPLV